MGTLVEEAINFGLQELESCSGSLRLPISSNSRFVVHGLMALGPKGLTRCLAAAHGLKVPANTVPVG